MNDCRPQCIDQLELLAQLTAKVDYLYQFYRSLSLSDLTDVENCLAPLKNQHLVFNGEVWNAENQKEVTLTVEPLIDSGVAIANITFNGDTTTIYCKDGTRVEVTPKPISGDKMPIADITVDGVPATIYSKDFSGDITNIINDITEINNIINNLHNTEVIVTPIRTSGDKIASISVDGVVKDLYAPTQEHFDPTPILNDSIENIKINNINGTVSNRIASLTLTGADIKITGYTESEDVNDDLELAPTDTVNEAFGKLAKALKDDEAAVTQAFNSVMEATGFDDMLHYQKEPAGTILGDDENVHSLQTADAKLQTKIKENIDRLTFHENNSLIFVPYGTTVAGTKTTTFSVKDKNVNDLPYVHVIQLPQQVIFNLTADYPLPANEYWTMGSGSHNVISVEMANYLYTDVLIRSGCILTFQTNATTWESYQYVGPNEGNRISVNGWTAPGNWYKLWTATQT